MNEKAAVRFETMPGKQGQMVWRFFGNYQVYEDGEWKKLYCFLMILGDSWMRYTGPPGAGKTHPASLPGLAAAQHRFSTYCINCHQHIERLEKAPFQNRLPDKLKVLVRGAVGNGDRAGVYSFAASFWKRKSAGWMAASANKSMFKTGTSTFGTLFNCLSQRFEFRRLLKKPHLHFQSD